MFGHYIGDSQPAIPVYRDYIKLKEILNLDSTYDEFFNPEAEREVIFSKGSGRKRDNLSYSNGLPIKEEISLSATPQAKALDGSYGGFQVKPSVEVIIVAQKPKTAKTYVDQALLWYEERQVVLCGLATELKRCYNIGDVEWENMPKV